MSRRRAPTLAEQALAQFVEDLDLPWPLEITALRDDPAQLTVRLDAAHGSGQAMVAMPHRPLEDLRVLDVHGRFAAYAAMRKVTVFGVDLRWPFALTAVVRHLTGCEWRFHGQPPGVPAAYQRLTPG